MSIHSTDVVEASTEETEKMVVDKADIQLVYVQSPPLIRDINKIGQNSEENTWKNRLRVKKSNKNKK